MQLGLESVWADRGNDDNSRASDSMTRFRNPEHDEILVSATVDFDPGCEKRRERACGVRMLFRCIGRDCPRNVWERNVDLGLVGIWDDVTADTRVTK